MYTVYEDEDILVINKPSGVASQAMMQITKPCKTYYRHKLLYWYIGSTKGCAA